MDTTEDAWTSESTYKRGEEGNREGISRLGVKQRFRELSFKSQSLEEDYKLVQDIFTRTVCPQPREAFKVRPCSRR